MRTTRAPSSLTLSRSSTRTNVPGRCASSGRSQYSIDSPKYERGIGTPAAGLTDAVATSTDPRVSRGGVGWSPGGGVGWSPGGGVGWSPGGGVGSSPGGGVGSSRGASGTRAVGAAEILTTGVV